MKKVIFALLALTSAILFSGCKQFEYRLVQPATAAQPISKQGISVPYNPLTYQITRRVDSVQMRINNPTEQPIRLIAEKSYLVAPSGETHPIQARVIAPHSFADVSFPPQPKYYDQTYPYAGYYRTPYWPYWYAQSYYATPRYQVTSPYDWEWEQGEIRVHLSYEQDSRPFEHDFILTREQLK